ncbi:unnamed protein product (macronuclear) [Paramecium tetraurelia]|uniref:Chromosome undetermined scaffold_67, whole genome shotgun sequence n=1 Tax=Paramecium tetraurelia TaxID=5888 RepID=Q3SDB4_PARTE|nr:uncharacterized protein GSPATT00021137001 [Paramecium tetraurelia]CAI44449.1 PMCA24 [Paramecium tetraurelia]CAK87494.1 unnamed protein product [Paramecium tetraurelia]|eukprot:XP_001454891.1 hypothetical protein (macronuclear) [Paramecium tetraurelia strain d4-2]
MFQEVLSYEQNLSASQDVTRYDPQQMIPKQALMKIVSAAQDRRFAEEIDELEKLQGISSIESGLKTNFTFGLKGDDFEQRNLQYGDNLKHFTLPNTYMQLLFQALEDCMIRILLGASIVSIVIGVFTVDDDHRSFAWIEGFAIFMAVLISCNVTAINDYWKQSQFQNLRQMEEMRRTVVVWRDGCRMDLSYSLVMVGDIIQICEGMEIPADCIVIEAADLTVDESEMTGETIPIKKDTYDNCIKQRNKLKNRKSRLSKYDVPSPVMLGGTKVLSGEGKMVVAVVGESSSIGKIYYQLTTQEEEPTPLQLQLEEFALQIRQFGLISAGLILFVFLMRFGIDRIKEGSFEKEHIRELVNFFIISITVIIVAIPECLPLIVTLNLAYSTKRMLQDNNLVRKLAACETMGRVDMVLTCKTGILTPNKMSVVQLWNEELMDIDAYKERLNLSTYLPAHMHELFIQSAIVNGTPVIRGEGQGNKTEVAMLLFAEQFGINYEKERNTHLATKKIPFSSRRKRMSTIIGDKRLVIKGAGEIILEGCNKLHSKSKGIIPIDSSIRTSIELAIQQMASQGLSTIALAYKDIKGNQDLEKINENGVYQIETVDLTLIAIVGIKDILRAEVPLGIAACKTAGIKVRMITGDNKLTALAIAKECGILIDENQSLVLEGADFLNRIGGLVCKQCQTSKCDCPRDQKSAYQLDKQIRVDTIKYGAEFDKIYPFLDVLARSRSEDKYALLVGLQERGYVVAVTGDGTSDVPILKKADVGFVMGIGGTEVARQSASIVLLDDNFNSILKAALWGRNIYDSIKKFLQFQLTVNIAISVLTLLSVIVIKQAVLEPIQMLWINLIMNTFAQLALVTESPTPELLKRNPQNINEDMISPKMFKNILGQAIYQMVVIMVLIFYGQTFIPEFKGEEDESIVFKGKLQYKYSNTYFDETNNLHICPNYTDYCNLISFNTDYYIDGSENYQSFYKETYIPSRQFTVIFNTFVIMQLFNFINARRVRNEINIFKGILSNTFFLTTVFGILALQLIIVTFGGIGFHCYSFYGLNIEQWLICLTFGVGSLVVRLILRVIPDPKNRSLTRPDQMNNSQNLTFPTVTMHDYKYQVQSLSLESESENENLNNPIQEYQS